MRVQSLTLRNFRNYDDQTVSLSPLKNLLIGPNGQGKTNLLEAVYILSHSYSHRTHQERELIRSGCAFATLSAVLEDNGVSHQLDVQYVLDASSERLKTTFKVNGSPLKNRSQFLGHLPTVSFFLSDLLLLRGTPDERRRWLDAAITQYDKRHLHWVSQYQKIKTQKSRLLKDDPGRISRGHLAAWNEQLAEAAARLAASRLAYLQKIQASVAAIHRRLAGADPGDPGQTLSLSYQSRALEDLTGPADLRGDGDVTQTDEGAERLSAALQARYLAMLAERQAEEIRRGTCLVGPHRDDFIARLGMLDAHSYGSQGQQRTIVLALKLAELELLTQSQQRKPVLLMDDVMAELDLSRQHDLIAQLESGSQVLMTTTHVDQAWRRWFEDGLETRVFHVSQGQLSVQASRAEERDEEGSGYETSPPARAAV